VKRHLTRIYVAIIVALMTIAMILPVTLATQSTSQDKTMSFIQQALPINSSMYTTALTSYSQMPSPLDTMPPIEVTQVTLDSKESTLVATCLIQNNVLIGCNMETKRGQLISDKQYVDLIDAAESFLEKYQEYTKIDSTEMIGMLANIDTIDTAKNSTITENSIKFTISNIMNFGREITVFTWFYSINGVDYTSLQVGFQKNGAFDALYDNRALYSIGDTTVNTPDKQAIATAMKYIQTFSYDMPDNIKVSGFNITEDQTTTQLLAYPINSTELRPYWNVKLYLNQTYPGSVKGFSIYIWANSGELFSCTLIAIGGVDTTDISKLDSTPTVTANSASKESNSQTQNMLYAFAIAVALIGLAVISVVASKKKR
jgi:hypothetical protein